MGVKVSLERESYRGTRKAFIRMKQAPVMMLLKETHIKIGWVYCRVRRMTKVKRLLHCLGFGHMAADCRGPDGSRCC